MSGNTIVTRPLVSQAFAPMCDICESSRGLWDSDGNRLNYCGVCGARIDWGFVVDADADNEVRAPRDGELDPPDEPAARRGMNTDRAIHEMLAGLANVRWRETMFEDLDWYYAEGEVYVLRCKHGTPNERLLVVRAKSPDEAIALAVFGMTPKKREGGAR